MTAQIPPGQSKSPFHPSLRDGEPDNERLSQALRLLPTEPKEALVQLKQLAELGSLVSAIKLAQTYATGQYSEIDPTQADKWYKRVAESGSPYGLWLVGRYYLGENRYREALEVLSASAAESYPPALRDLSRLYIHGWGVLVDIPKGKELLERSAALGHVFAKRYLALWLMRGDFGAIQRLRGVFLFARVFIDLIPMLWHGVDSEKVLD